MVTGLGAVSSLGTGVEAHRAAMWSGRDGLRPVERFDTRAINTKLAATWPGWDGRVQPEPGPDLDLASTARDFPLHELALVAAREAWASAGSAASLRRTRARLRHLLRPRVPRVPRRRGARRRRPGPRRVRASRSRRRARRRRTPSASRATCCFAARPTPVVAGGADTLLREAFAGFSALGVLSAGKCAPFSDPPGTTLGEGAGFVVFERAADVATPRRATVGEHSRLRALRRRLPRDDPRSLGRGRRARHPCGPPPRGLGSGDRRLRQRARHGDDEQRPHRVVRHRARARRPRWAARRQRLQEPDRAHAGRRRRHRAGPAPDLPARRQGTADAPLPGSARRLPGRSRGRQRAARTRGEPGAQAVGGLRGRQRGAGLRDRRRRRPRVRARRPRAGSRRRSQASAWSSPSAPSAGRARRS